MVGLPSWLGGKEDETEGKKPKFELLYSQDLDGDDESSPHADTSPIDLKSLETAKSYAMEALEKLEILTKELVSDRDRLFKLASRLERESPERMEALTIQISLRNLLERKQELETITKRVKQIENFLDWSAKSK